MSVITKRSLLLGLASLAGGCAAFDTNVSQVSDKVSLIAQGLRDAVSRLQDMNVPGLTADVMTKVGVALSDLRAAADALKGAADQAAAQPIVQKVYTYVQAIFNALSPILSAIPDPTVQLVVQAIQAAEVLLPIVFSLVGLVLPAQAPRFKMTPSEAELILRAQRGK